MSVAPESSVPNPASANPAPSIAASSANPALEGVKFIDYDTFSQVELRVAEIMTARIHPKADKLLVLQLRVGEREKQICAGIRAYYAPENLIGKRIVIVDNLAPRQLRGEVSEGMLLAASTENPEQLTLVTLDNPAFPSGAKVR